MIDFEKRLTSLKNRRHGAEEIAALSKRAEFSEALESLSNERDAFEALRELNGIKYAIGAMASVGKKYTDTSINEGYRVANAVTAGLHTLGESVTSKLQGSVALDIHIKGFSDVDMLIICNNPISTQRPHLNPSVYSDSKDPRSIHEIVDSIATNSERIISSKFYAASVKRGNKSIVVEGGSLTRKVDIVPAIWHDSHDYQRSRQEHDRGIQIYDRSKPQLLANYPFTHIKKVEERDQIYSGSLKSLIRLIKNMIADMPDYKNQKAKKLSSYDIAAICYHMDSELRVPQYFQLGLIEKLRIYLDYIANNSQYRFRLDVPDGTRKIFDSPEKIEALNILRSEVADLVTSIAREINPYHSTYTPVDILNKAVVF
ncbi:MAG: hypothetical protein WAO71_05125 [Gallionella sp.]